MDNKEFEKWLVEKVNDLMGPSFVDASSCFDEILSKYKQIKKTGGSDMTKTGLQKMVEFLKRELKSSLKDTMYYNAIDRALSKARQLLSEEEVQKPVPAGLLNDITAVRDMLEHPMGYDFNPVKMLNDVISRHPSSPVQEESLAELADRKDRWIEFGGPRGTNPESWLNQSPWSVVVCDEGDGYQRGEVMFCYPTLKEAESFARAYLASLPDLKGGWK